MDRNEQGEVIVLEVRNTTDQAIPKAFVFPGPSDNKRDSPMVYMVHSHDCYSDQLIGMITENRNEGGFTKTVLTGLSINDPVSQDWNRSGAGWSILARQDDKLVQWHSGMFPRGHSPYALRLGLSKIERLPPIIFDEAFTMTIREFAAKSRLVFIFYLVHR